MALKWGFSSAGRIAHDFLNAMATIDNNDHQVVAISDPDIGRAEEIAKQFGIPKFYGSSVELAQDPDIELVHVGALNPFHYEVAMIMLDHGKHVLVEKPMCMNAKQVQKLINRAKEKNLFLMEGLWPRFFPRYYYIREQIRSGKLGDILSVEVEFGSLALGDMERVMRKHLGGSVTLDVGVYTTQFCQFVFQQEPKQVKATGIVNEDGVDIEVTAELYYDDNKVAKMQLSALNAYENAAKIIGTKGTIKVPFFWSPLVITDVDCTEKHFPPFPKSKFEYKFARCDGLRYEPDEVRKCIRSGKKECENAHLSDSLIIARIQDEIRRQIGVKFPADDE